MNEEERVQPFGLWRYGEEFLAAAKKIKDPKKPEHQMDHHAPTPALYLASHAIELFLKSFLRAKGKSLPELRKIGHDLVLALLKAEQESLGELLEVSEERKREVECLNRTYSSKNFEYFKQGYFELPYYCRICSFADELRNSIQECAYIATKTQVGSRTLRSITMEFRHATLDDCQLLAEMNQYLLQDERHRNRSMSLPQLEERMQGFLSGEYQAVIFESHGDIVAYALYREQPDEIYLRQLFVVRGQRRKGLGDRAVKILRSDIWPKHKRLVVDVLMRNKSALAFWRAIGYRDCCLELEILPDSST